MDTNPEIIGFIKTKVICLLPAAENCIGMHGSMNLCCSIVCILKFVLYFVHQLYVFDILIIPELIMLKHIIVPPFCFFLSVIDNILK